MDFVKSWTLNISITLIIAVALSLLTPKGSIGKFYKIILSSFIVFSFILPFVENDISVDLPVFDIVQTDENQRNMYEKMVENQIKDELIKNNYKSCIVNCKISIKGDEIYINKIQVSIPDTYEKEAVKKLIFDNLGLNSEVYFLGE